jgi:hypothetical protein
MHAVVRNYSGAGAKELFDLLEQRKADVEAVIRKVPGLMSYTLLRSDSGGVSVTVCKDKAGGRELESRARLDPEKCLEYGRELTRRHGRFSHPSDQIALVLPIGSP